MNWNRNLRIVIKGCVQGLIPRPRNGLGRVVSSQTLLPHCNSPTSSSTVKCKDLVIVIMHGCFQTRWWNWNENANWVTYVGEELINLAEVITLHFTGVLQREKTNEVVRFHKTHSWPLAETGLVNATQKIT